MRGAETHIPCSLKEGTQCLLSKQIQYRLLVDCLTLQYQYDQTIGHFHSTIYKQSKRASPFFSLLSTDSQQLAFDMSHRSAREWGVEEWFHLGKIHSPAQPSPSMYTVCWEQSVQVTRLECKMSNAVELSKWWSQRDLACFDEESRSVPASSSDKETYQDQTSLLPVDQTAAEPTQAAHSVSRQM